MHYYLFYLIGFLGVSFPSYFSYSFNVCFPPFALMQKVEPKDQGCPDAPPGSPANAQQPRATCCIILCVNNPSFPALSSLQASFLPL
jgi:hypothetical protein